METPPRTWRRRSHRAAPCECGWKHLHGREEDLASKPITGTVEETPPRTWRRPFAAFFLAAALGNTSTDVEKTQLKIRLYRSAQKHLHGRGEDLFGIENHRASLETPPRTWRRLRRHSSSAVSAWKHLHGRGEDLKEMGMASALGETPPRTWRRRHHAFLQDRRVGNTSTDVEKTIPDTSLFSHFRKHLHGRGEDS